MWRNLLIQALHQVAVLLVLNFSSLTILGLKDDGDKAHAYKVKNSLIFNAFVMCQKFNEFNARKPEEINCFRGVTKNYLFMGIVGFTLILQYNSIGSCGLYPLASALSAGLLRSWGSRLQFRRLRFRHSS
ncbi:calcium-transporting ATPase 9, plasma membrane-type-like [Hibiscus syriacus]|uniref:calcium-transporting ATPase 9, plasma membrane-type-like n=1 Tax=Hibiscus syriacus TaxID=106335 RepID=UPI001920B66E|nr:calcium-transporting ATPase 9, plasma membrane-type-like [Hibiscus syriacus]